VNTVVLLLLCQIPPFEFPPTSRVASLGDASEANAGKTPANPAERSQDDSGTAVVSESQSNTNLQHVGTSPVYQPPTIAEQMLAASNVVSGIYRTELPVLDAAAQDYANVLARTTAQGHFVQGSDVEGRVRRFGFTGTIAGPVTISRIDGKPCRGLGEVIHYGSPTISGAFASLMKSDGHRDAIMEPSYDVAGFGYSVNQYTRQPIYVGVYGNSRQAAPAATAIPAARSAVSYTQPRAFSTCGPNGCRQVFYPQQPQQTGSTCSSRSNGSISGRVCLDGGRDEEEIAPRHHRLPVWRRGCRWVGLLHFLVLTMSQPTRVYSNGEISVEWRAELCIHCENCFRGLPQVFDPTKRPWVNINGASSEEIKRQVGDCPSGALSIA
jgi:uncharacterized Fe-S cluster protein YjdI